MAKYYWLKLKDSFFGETFIKAIRTMPKGDSMVNAYLEMALHSLKTEGVVEYKGFMPTIAEELAVAVSEPVPLIKKTLEVLTKFGIVIIGEDKSAVFSEVVNNIFSETPTAERTRNCRKRKELQGLQCNTDVTEEALQCNTDVTEKALQCNTDVTEKMLHCNTEIEIETEIETKTKTETETDAPLPPQGETDASAIVGQFNALCKALPQVRDITASRKKAIASAVKRLGAEGVIELFRKTAASDYLCGKISKNNKNWRASFDWIMKPDNITKILEGNYDNTVNPEKEDYTCGGKFVNILEQAEIVSEDDYPF